MPAAASMREEPAPVNYVRGLVEFLVRWDRRDESSRTDPVYLAVSGNGNINLSGSPESYASYLLTRWHPSFEPSIEPGVRALVLALVDAWDCVTYSSCEGHRADGTSPARLRHVRLIARSSEEHQHLRRRLEQLAAATNDSLPSSPVRLRVASTIVTTEDGLQALGLDLLFEPHGCDQAGYAGALPQFYEESLRHVKASHRL